MATNITMVKKVNVVAKIPIRTIIPPMFGEYKGISMSPANILKCLIQRAVVDEVLSDGSLVRLDMKNYNKDNSYLVKKKEPEMDTLKAAMIPEEDKSPVKIIKNEPIIEDILANIEPSEGEEKIDISEGDLNQALEIPEEDKPADVLIDQLSEVGEENDSVECTVTTTANSDDKYPAKKKNKKKR